MAYTIGSLVDCGPDLAFRAVSNSFRPSIQEAFELASYRRTIHTWRGVLRRHRNNAYFLIDAD